MVLFNIILNNCYFFIADLVTDIRVAGGISEMPFILIVFPIFMYGLLLIIFSVIVDSCKRDLKKILL